MRFNTGARSASPLAAPGGPPYDPRHVSRSRDFLRSLLGPHVLFAFAIGFLRGCQGTWSSANLLIPLAFGFVAASAAVLANRLTGNRIVSGCAGALVVLHVETTLTLLFFSLDRTLGPWFALPDGLALLAFRGMLAAACGFLAAGIRLMPVPALAHAPLMGNREWAAVALLVAGALSSPVVLAMPALIVLADLAFAPAGLRPVARRTALLFVVHAAAVSFAFVNPVSTTLSWSGPHTPAAVTTSLFLSVFEPFSRFSTIERHAQVLSAAALVLLALAGLVLLLMRKRIRQTLVIAAAFAFAWTVASAIPGLFERDVWSPLATFGFALLVPTILWRIAVAITAPLRAPIAEPPLPSVPALRDFIRRRRGPRPPHARPGRSASPRGCVRRSNARSRARSPRRSSRSASRSADRTRRSRPGPPSRCSGTGS